MSTYLFFDLEGRNPTLVQRVGISDSDRQLVRESKLLIFRFHGASWEHQYLVVDGLGERWETVKNGN